MLARAVVNVNIRFPEQVTCADRVFLCFFRPHHRSFGVFAHVASFAISSASVFMTCKDLRQVTHARPNADKRESE